MPMTALRSCPGLQGNSLAFPTSWCDSFKGFFSLYPRNTLQCVFSSQPHTWGCALAAVWNFTTSWLGEFGGTSMSESRKLPHQGVWWPKEATAPPRHKCGRTKGIKDLQEGLLIAMLEAFLLKVSWEKFQRCNQKTSESPQLISVGYLLRRSQNLLAQGQRQIKITLWP